VLVTASAETGLATIWDADVLIWAASQIRAAKSMGKETSRTFQVSTYDLLRGIERPTGGDQYKRLVETFQRLTSTSVQTTIRSDRKQISGFNWLESWTIPLDEYDKPKGIRFTISEWLYEGILDDRLALSIDRDYFKLKSGLERWLYRVVRKHGGRQAKGWMFTMSELHHKSASLMRLADFAKDIRRLVERQTVPGYHLTLTRDSKGVEVLHFVAKDLLPKG
jgi:plasmid replication initiation protein